MSLLLIVGGVRSGKSAVAERLAAGAAAPVCYLATGAASDPEMAERIAMHRRRRPSSWRTVESDDPAAVAVGEGETLLLDGIAPWIARLLREGGLWTDEAVAPLGAEGRAAWEGVVAAVRAFAEAAARRPGLTLVVAEESGLGLLPHGAAARRYLDLAGDALQALAASAERVLLVIAGRVTELAEADPRAAPTPTVQPPAEPTVRPQSGVAVRPPAEPTIRPPPAATVWPWAEPTVPPQPGAAFRSWPEPVPAELRLHGDTMAVDGQLDFAVNVVPGGPPGWLRKELDAALDRAGAYPDEREAVAALAERHRRAQEEVLPTNGSAEAFWLLASALRPAHAAVVHPGFTEPEAALRAAGHRVTRAFRHPSDFALDPAAVPAEADLVVLGNPNNPTGTLDPAEAVAELVRPGRVVVVDEAFMELLPGEPESLASRADLPGLVVVRSLTKVWSLAAVRAGYLLAPAGIVAAARAVRQPWSVNGPACAALAAWARRTAASAGAEAAAIARHVAAARAELSAALAALPGVRVWPSAANFLLIRVPDGQAVRSGLARRGIAVRPAHTFPGLGGDHLRLAVRDPPDNRRLVASLRAVLQELPLLSPAEAAEAGEASTAPQAPAASEPPAPRTPPTEAAEAAPAPRAPPPEERG